MVRHDELLQAARDDTGLDDFGDELSVVIT
jgi:hypothetical protein